MLENANLKEFSWALKQMKKARIVRRKSWEKAKGPHPYLFLSTREIIQNELGTVVDLDLEHQGIPHNEICFFKKVPGKDQFAHYMPTQDDLLAKDWVPAP